LGDSSQSVVSFHNTAPAHAKGLADGSAYPVAVRVKVHPSDVPIDVGRKRRYGEGRAGQERLFFLGTVETNLRRLIRFIIVQNRDRARCQRDRRIHWITQRNRKHLGGFSERISNYFHRQLLGQFASKESERSDGGQIVSSNFRRSIDCGVVDLHNLAAG
jgi:hypothetical protein